MRSLAPVSLIRQQREVACALFPYWLPIVEPPKRRAFRYGPEAHGRGAGAFRAGKILRVETLASAIVHWSGDDWRTVEDVATRDLGLGIHSADLRTQALAEGSQVDFTFRWPDADRWEGENFAVRVAEDGGPR